MVMDPLIGRELDGRYLLLERLGKGGMGTVYKATQKSMERVVAVKLISPQHFTDDQVTKRFLREARLAGRIAHPHIISAFDFGCTEDGLHYLVMEYIKGRTLEETLTVEGPFSAERSLTIGLQLCDALTAAHGHGVLHRDLKPANFILVETLDCTDVVKVLDFGLASLLDADSGESLTQKGVMMGTAAYLPPEVARGHRSDERGDLYTLGVILYEMVAGGPPFAAVNTLAMVMHHAFQPPPPLPDSIPIELTVLIDRLLAKEPEDRPQSSTILRGELANALQAIRHRALSPQPEIDEEDPILAPPDRRALWVALGLFLGGLGYIALVSDSQSVPVATLADMAPQKALVINIQQPLQDASPPSDAAPPQDAVPIIDAQPVTKPSVTKPVRVVKQRKTVKRKVVKKKPKPVKPPVAAPKTKAPSGPSFLTVEPK